MDIRQLLDQAADAQGNIPQRIIGHNTVFSAENGVGRIEFLMTPEARARAPRSKLKVDEKTGKTSGGKVRLLASVAKFQIGDLTLSLNAMLPLSPAAGAAPADTDGENDA